MAGRELAGRLDISYGHHPKKKAIKVGDYYNDFKCFSNDGLYLLSNVAVENTNLKKEKDRMSLTINNNNNNKILKRPSGMVTAPDKLP